MVTREMDSSDFQYVLHLTKC